MFRPSQITRTRSLILYSSVVLKFNLIQYNYVTLNTALVVTRLKREYANCLYVWIFLRWHNLKYQYLNYYILQFKGLSEDKDYDYFSAVRSFDVELFEFSVPAMLHNCFGYSVLNVGPGSNFTASLLRKILKTLQY